MLLGSFMKLGKQVIQLVEDGLSGLSASELKKFWKDMQENVFKQHASVKKNDMGLFLDGTHISFGSVQDDEDGNLDSDFIKHPASHMIGGIDLTAFSPKEICQMVLNDYTLDRESTDEEDDQAFEYFLKTLKGETVYFYGDTEVSGYDVSYEGTAKIKNFKYNPSADELVVTDADIVKLEVEQD